MKFGWMDMILFNHLHIARDRARGVGRTTRLSGREGDRRQSNESGKRGKRDEKGTIEGSVKESF